MLAARVEPKNALQESEKTDNFKPLVFRQFQAGVDRWLLIGDETALPSIGRRVEGLPQGVRAITLVAVNGPVEEQVLDTRADHQAIWVHRAADEATNAQPVLEALKRIELPPGDGFVWIAAEAKVARAARDHIVNVRRHPAQWIRASGYWTEGQADAYERSES
jgi:NADPH-dependent ferric siderophore reductase